MRVPGTDLRFLAPLSFGAPADYHDPPARLPALRFRTGLANVGLRGVVSFMYQVGGWLDWFRTNREPTTVARPTRAVSPNVLFLGLTSLFTDISSEMVVSVLPVYLVGFLRMTPLQFGVVDGLYQGVAGLVQLASAG